MRDPERIQAHLNNLRMIDTATFGARLNAWLTSNQLTEPPRIATRVRINNVGVALLSLPDAAKLVWSESIRRRARNCDAVMFPWIAQTQKGVVITCEKGTIWSFRAFDPELRLFWGKGWLRGQLVRVYVAQIPVSGKLHLGGVELVFSSRYRTERPAIISLDSEDIREVASIACYRSEQARLLPVRKDQRVVQLVVGNGVPSRLASAISGEMELVIRRESTSNFTYLAFGAARYLLCREDLAALNASVGDTVTLTVEEGRPVAVRAKNGAVVFYRTVRAADGNLRYSSRKRIPPSALPPVAIVDHTRIVQCRDQRKLPFLQVRGPRQYVRAWIPPHLAHAGKDEFTVVVLARRHIVYAALRETLNPTEYQLAVRLAELESVLPTAHLDRATCEYIGKLIAWVKVKTAQGRLSQLGLYFLAIALRKECNFLWENPPSVGSLRIAASMVRVALTGMLQQLQPPEATSG